MYSIAKPIIHGVTFREGNSLGGSPLLDYRVKSDANWRPSWEISACYPSSHHRPESYPPQGGPSYGLTTFSIGK